MKLMNAVQAKTEAVGWRRILWPTPNRSSTASS